MELKVRIEKKLEAFRLDADFLTQRKQTGLLGASGCGKSMTLKAIAGIVRPDEGHIELNGRVLFDSAKRINVPPQKRNVGYLFQNYALFPNMTVAQNIAAGLGRGAGVRARVDEMLRLFDLAGLEERLPGQLSGGQQQRVALARIIAYRPEAILLDEPFSALDAWLKDRLQTELFEILSQYDGMVLMVSHDRDELYRFAEELVVMEKGAVALQGPTREVFRNPRTKPAAILTGCKNFSAARRLDAHTIQATGWGITLHTKSVVPEDCDCVGCRAHDLEPLYGARRENCIAFRPYAKAELPFEKNYYIKPARGEFSRGELITWAVQQEHWRTLEERGLPDYLQFKEERLLFLREEAPRPGARIGAGAGADAS